MTCDVSWKSSLSKLNDENVLLKTQVDYVVQERENIKLEYQKLFNSIKATRAQHQQEVNELIEHVNQNTYANGVESSNSVRRSKSKDTKSKNGVLNNTIDKEPSYRHCSEVIQLVLWIVDSGCSKHMTGNLQLLRNFVKKFMGIVRFGNDHFTAITGYGDYVQGNLMICHVYYVEGLGHNLFSVRQFCDGDLKAAFRSNTCYVWILEGDDLLISSCDLNLYTIFISKLAASSPVCLMVSL
ncbi:hypothetical protein Tco_1319477 [Tanacetum coccineum]